MRTVRHLLECCGSPTTQPLLLLGFQSSDGVGLTQSASRMLNHAESKTIATSPRKSKSQRRKLRSHQTQCPCTSATLKTKPDHAFGIFGSSEHCGTAKPTDEARNARRAIEMRTHRR